MPDKLAGRTLGDFRLDELVGRGASGKVYRATQLSLRRTVAVKVLEEGLFTLPEMKDRFVREAEFIARLEHPNIIPVYAAGNEGNLYFFAMRFIQGTTLAERMTSGLPIAEGVRPLADIAAALSYAHARGILHRDVKPANIMIADGAAVLADFGLARLLEQSTITASSALLGTPLYRSPEAKPTFRSDLYALGVILYELAAGRHPYGSAGRDELMGKIRAGVYEPPPQPEIAAIVAKAMRMEYAAAGEMERDLRSLADRDFGAAPAVPAPKDEEPVVEPKTQYEEKRPTLRTFGKFLLHDRLGHGGMGIVFKAEQTDLRRLVALKVLQNEEDPGTVRRFLQEAQSAARLRHTNIVPIHEVGEIDGKHYFTMDLIEGENLDSAPRMPAKRAVEIARDVARAVHYAHEQGIIHRDLKPGNILLDRAGRALVTDFGLAKDLKVDQKLTASGEVFGTPAYMAPEQAQGRPTAASDIYALGAVLYHLLTGGPPHAGATAFDIMLSVIGREPVAPRAIEPKIHADVETICLKALDKDPWRRYPDADAFADDCDRFLAGEPILAKPTGAVTRLLRRLARSRAVVAAVAITLILLGGGVGTWRYASAKSVRREIETLRPRAEAAEREGRHADAAALFGRISALDPDDADARSRAEAANRRANDALEKQRLIEKRMGSILILSPADRIPEWTALIAIDPGRAAFWRERGLCRIQARQNEEARRDLLEALRLDSTDAGAHFGMATLYQDIDRDEEKALEEFALAAKHDPSGWAGVYGHANLLMHRNDYAGAVEVLTKVLALRPDFVLALNDRSVCHKHLGQLDRALADLDRALELDKRFVFAYVNRAVVRRQRNELSEAGADAETAVALDPIHPKCWSARGEVRVAQKRFDEAVADFKKAGTLAPKDPEYPLLAAQARHRQGRLADAHREIDAALALRPGWWEALRERASLYVSEGKFAEAEEPCRQAMQSEPDDPHLQAHWAQILMNTGRAAESLDWFERATRKIPEQFALWINYGSALLSLGREEDALRCYSRASAIPGEGGIGHNGIGHIYEQRKEYDRAIEEYRESVKRGYVPSWYSIGVCHSRKKEYREARAAFEKTLELDTNPRRRQQAQGALDQIRNILGD